MAYEEIRLHGGPKHGAIAAIEDGSTHFHIRGLDVDLSQFSAASAELAVTSEVPFKKGTYSRVGKSHDFEWDGWVIKHD